MTEKDINRAIRALIVACTGMLAKDVRPANQGSPASGNFATVLITEISKEGHDNDTFANIPNDPNDALTETVTGQRKCMASIQFFRQNARDQAAKFETRVNMAMMTLKMQELGIGFIQTLPIRDLSVVVNSTWEGRAQLDMEFYVVATETDTVASFTANITVIVKSDPVPN